MAASSSKKFKNICVLSGFHYGKYKEFVQVAVDLGRVIAERKLHLVYGGGERGLSRLVSETVLTRGSQVLGIIPKPMKPLVYMSGPPIGEELVVSSMQERISEMMNRADTFIFLPGDLATFEALITFASWAYLNIHKKPIAYTPEPDPKTFALDWSTDDGSGNSSSNKKCKLDLTLRL
ncbi:hypothetical protein WN944_015286 [Citrus x changshan-huyou]|uniref:cytokinin riboside 5'-monophosphate phosphoribohydrolase n=1 Tax=Citrus x changshan-huyou TaxID=2935761 RepID=A0AAP0QLL3_9ROSI